MALQGAAEWNRLKAIEAACRKAVTQEGDDLCWMDLYRDLAGLLGVPFDPKLLGTARMLENCKHFVQCLVDGGAYQPDQEAMEDYEHLEWLLQSDEHGVFVVPGHIKISYLTRFVRDHVPRLLGIEGDHEVH